MDALDSNDIAFMKWRENANKYIAVVAWARHRYTRGDTLMIHHGGIPTRYSVIEDLASSNYLGLHRRWLTHTLVTAIKE